MKKFMEIEQALIKHGVTYDAYHTQGESHAVQLAQQAVKDGADAVVCVGGDGTVKETALGLFKSGVPLGILPTGTGNDYVRSLGIHSDHIQALEQMLQGRPVWVDVGFAGEKMFINAAGIGFDVDVCMHTQSFNKRFKGMTAYYLGVIKALIKLKGKHLKLTQTDGRVIEKDVLLVAFGNGSHFGGGMRVCPDARIDDGLLDVCVINSVPRRTILRLFPKFISGEHLKMDIVEYFRCEEVMVTSNAPFMQLDGTVTPFQNGTLRIQKNGICVIVPA